jgi:histidinol-phosphatase
MASTPIKDYLDFAIEAAWQAGKYTMAYFQSDFQTEYKADDSPVTIADRTSEKIIREKIEKAFPTHSIIGEEYGGALDSTNPYRWIIDPIDGTQSFIRGVHLYSVLIALEINKEVVVGVANFPALGELMAAGRGEGCYCNGRACHVSQVSKLNKASLCYTLPRFDEYKPKTINLLKATGWQGGWGDAYGYMMVASGRADVMIDQEMSPWDCAPWLPILEEAGGAFTDWQGQRTIYGPNSIGTNGHLLPQVVEILA